MLEQAIVDAESLKEAARQSAEEKIVEHFSKDIKQAVDMILEQEEGMEGMDDLFGAAPPTEPAAPTVDLEAPKNTKDNGKFVVDQLPYASTTSNDTFVSIDLDRLEESIRHQLEEDDVDPAYLEEEFVLDEEELEETLEETGAGRTGASQGDESKTHRGEKDYTWKAGEDSKTDKGTHDDGSRKGDESKTHRGEKDYTWKAGEDSKTDKGTHDDGSRKGDKSDTGKGKDYVKEGKNLVQMIKDILLEESDEIFEEADETLEEEADKNTGMSGLKGDDDDDTYEGHFKKDTLEEDDTPDAMYEAYEAYESVQLQQESRSLKSKNKTLITEQKTLNKKVRLLEEKLQKYGTVINKLKDKLNETNLTNAKLLYQNRVLDSASLNERQKDRIVETIMNAKTVEEAKIIYETLQSAVGANTLSRKPKSLNEVVTKRSSAFMPRKEEKRVDPFTVRMKALAGIKD